jgi:hypothetical protein
MAKVKDVLDIATPPLPKWMLDPKDAEYVEPVALKPEDFRARLQIEASKALDIVAWHAANLANEKASQAACNEILDRAGFVAPAKGKSDVGAPPANGGGELLAPVEDDVKGMSEAFEQLKITRAIPEPEEPDE